VATHQVEPTRETLHGVFSRDFAPILIINPGDTVVFRTIDAGWGIEGPEVPRKHFEDFIPDRRGDGHAMCGPIAICGARPGMMLEAKLKQIIPSTWGWTLAGGWDSPINRRLGIVGGGDHRLNWALDTKRMIGRDQFGRTVALKPFMGVMGLAPAEPRRASTVPPRREGGNIDCKELVGGTSLFLPIAVDGALFSTGDGHAAQGDGEVSGMAIECPMERVEVEFHLHEKPPIQTAHARLANAWLTFGFNENLNEAAGDALEAMILLLQARHGLSKLDALAIASVCVDMRITQVVNQVWGAHALLADNAFNRA